MSPPSRRGGRADQTDVSLLKEIGAAGVHTPLLRNALTSRAAPILG